MALQQIKPTLVVVLEPGLAGLKQHFGLRGRLVTTGRNRWGDRDQRGRQQGSKSEGSTSKSHGSTLETEFSLAASTGLDLHALPWGKTECDWNLSMVGMTKSHHQANGSKQKCSEGPSTQQQPRSDLCRKRIGRDNHSCNLTSR